MKKGLRHWKAVCWRWLIISIFESGSRSIIAVRVASARSALATLVSVKRGWLTEYEVGSGVWRSWLCRSTKLVASWVRGSTEPAAERLRGSSHTVPATLAGLGLWKPNSHSKSCYRHLRVPAVLSLPLALWLLNYKSSAAPAAVHHCSTPIQVLSS